MDNESDTATNNEGVNIKGNKSSSKSIKTILKDYRSILYFIPLILLISSDDATLLVN